MILIELTSNYPSTYRIHVPIWWKVGYQLYDIIDAQYSNYPIEDIVECMGDSIEDILDCGDSTEWENGDSILLTFVHTATRNDELQYTQVPIFANSMYATFDITFLEKPLVGEYQLFAVDNDNQLLGHCLVRVIDNLPDLNENEITREMTQYQEYER